MIFYRIYGVAANNMKEGTCEKGELVSLRVKIQNMQYRLMKAEETSATLYENFATGLLDEQEYLALKEHYVQVINLRYHGLK